MFKHEVFFKNTIKTLEEDYGLKLVGQFQAGSDRFQYHVDQWYSKARETVMVFTIPGKAIAMVFTYHENIWSPESTAEGVAKYQTYWSANLGFDFIRTEDFSFSRKFLVEEWEKDCGYEYTVERFPYPENWRPSYSIQGGTYVTYAMECSYDARPGNLDLIALVSMATERNLAAFVADGKLETVCPELWSPNNTFVDCLPTFHKEFTAKTDLLAIADRVSTDLIIRNRTDGYKLSDYVGITA